jgi:hypothetical protein
MKRQPEQTALEKKDVYLLWGGFIPNVGQILNKRTIFLSKIKKKS